MSWFRRSRSAQYADAISRAEFRVPEISNGQLCKVLFKSSIIGQDARFLYEVKKQIVQPSSGQWLPTDAQDTTTMKALSVSELSNAVNPYSYGVTKANLPAGFSAVPIPDGSFVWCVPHRLTDGDFVWLIVNTQAIDGVCT